MELVHRDSENKTDCGSPGIKFKSDKNVLYTKTKLKFIIYYYIFISA